MTKLIILVALLVTLAFVGNNILLSLQDAPSYQVTTQVAAPTEADHLRSEVFWWTIYLCPGALLFLLVVGTLLGAWRFLVVPGANDRERIHYDPATGLAPIVRRNVAPWWKRIRGINEYDELDGNLTFSPHRKVYSNGKLAVSHDMNGGDSDTQRTLAGGVKLVQAKVAGRGKDGRAARGMTQAEAMLYAGTWHERTRKEKLTADLAELKLMDAQGRGGQADQPLLTDRAGPQNEELTLADTLRRSQPGQVILGQAQNFERTIYELDLHDNPFVMIAGRRRCGKTTQTGFHIALAALYWGWSVTVFEPENNNNWMKFGAHINLHKLTSDNVLAHMQMVANELQRRGDVMRQNGLVKWQDNPRLLPPFVVVFEELGAMRDAMKITADGKPDKESIQRLDAYLSRIIKEAAKLGLIFVALDQYPSAYAPGTLGGFEKIAFYLGATTGSGNIVNSSMNHKLRGTRNFDAGEIDEDSNPIFFGAWHVEPELPKFLLDINMPPAPEKLIHDNCHDVVVAEDRQTGRARAPIRFEEPEQEVRPDEPQDPVSIYPRSIRGYRKAAREGMYDGLAWRFFCEYPQAKQVELRQCIAAVVNDGRNKDDFKFVGHKLYNRYSPNGDEYEGTKPESEDENV